MTARFVALPVREGDAFFLKTGSMSLLVDGGVDEMELPGLLAGHATVDLDIVICTHNDEDHAVGLLGALKSPLVSIGELWLPGRIRDVLDWVDDHNAISAVSEAYDGVWSENLFDDAPHEPAQAEEAAVGARGVPEAAASLDDQGYRRAVESARILESSIDDAERQLRSRGRHITIGRRAGRLSPRQRVQALKNILALADAAFSKGVPVRWLEHSTNGPRFTYRGITALNATDAAKAAARRRSLPDLLDLTVVNRESMTFHVNVGPRLDVLFSADAGRQLGVVPGDLGLITAPHHGSGDRENVRAYKTFPLAANDAALVRSDQAQEEHESRPCDSFLAWPQERRFCTQCRGSSEPQPVELEASARWEPLVSTTSCRCLPRVKKRLC